MLSPGLCLIVILATVLGQSRAWGVSVDYVNDRPHCTVTGNGNNTNDVPILKEAFQTCGKHGGITFPKDQNFWIAEKFNPIVDDVHIQWYGKWTVSPPKLASDIGKLTILLSFRTISRTGGITHII